MASQPAAIVLLSAGLDSSYNLYRALNEMSVRLTLTFNYGQRAARQEIECAKALSNSLGLEHRVIDAPWFKDFSRSSLTDLATDVPTGVQIGIDDLHKSTASAKSVWVPNRNGVLLNIAAAYAEGLGAQVVVPGFNIEEAATFPDNSEEFLRRLDESWQLSTATSVRTHCFSTRLNKSEIVKDGIQLNLPFAKLWPCYLDTPRWCGSCESCQRYRRALEANQLSFTDLNQ